VPAPQAYWDVTFAERHKGSEADLTAELADLLRSAVKSRMVADVPLGAFLSGGVDSSSVVALMAEESSHPVRTCSIGFDVKALDETGYAEQIASATAPIMSAASSAPTISRRWIIWPPCSTSPSPMPAPCRHGASANWRAKA
jgi:hypothetical protein